MAITKPTIGQANWGPILNAALDSLDADIAAKADSSTVAGKLAAASNLSDVASAATARTNLSLGNVDNTSDASKPVSTAQATAIGLKAPIASPTFTGTVSGITKTMVGLGSVDNTADTAKPVSTAQTAAFAPRPQASQNPLTGMFHVDGYGADPTGAADSGPAINLAITDAKVNGGTVYLPPGTYLISTVINMSNIHTSWDPYTGSNVTLKGAGHQSTKLTGGEASYGFIEMVGSQRLIIEGLSIIGSSSRQYGILGGRTTGDASSSGHIFRDVYIYGDFTLAGLFMMSSESCSYEDVIVYTVAGPACVLARDLRGWTATAKHTALSATTIISGGNGLNTVERCMFVTYRTIAGGGTNDSPLTIEYVQSFRADRLYLLSSGAPFVTINKGCHQATFIGMSQEGSGAVGATEAIGVSVKDTTSGSEPKVVRLAIEGSTIYPIYGADNQKFSQLSVRGTGWRSSALTWIVDVYSADLSDLPTSYTAIGTHEQTTPTYRARTGQARITKDAHRTVFTGAQTDTLYDIPPGAKVLTLQAQGNGGGGGSGRRGAAASIANGGGGGGTGGYCETEINVSELNGMTLRVTVGAAGTGGAAVAVDSTSGAAGVSGGYCQVATSASGGGSLVRVSGGSAGGGGTNVAGGTAGTGGLGRFVGQNGQAASATGLAGSAPSVTPLSSPGAGGAGGGITAADAASAGGGGYPCLTFTPTGATGGAINTAGAAGGNPGANVIGQGGGGAGGGSSVTAAGGAGGAGGYGGGGGGGGASRDGFASGAGGAGGAGYVAIIARF